MKKIITLLLLTFTSVGVFYQMFSNANGASSQTPAPGEVTCSQSGCHGSGNGEGSSGGLADNMGGGSVVISGISGTYVSGTLYHINVRVNQLGGGKFGFNCEALDASNGNAGTLTITQAGTWIRSGINGTRNCVSQGHSGTSGPTAGVGTDFFDFAFDWTAPASSIGPVTFYASGLAVNMSGLNDAGDEVYSSSLTVNPTVLPTAQILLSRSTFTFPSFYALPNTVGNQQVFWAAGQGLTGNLTAAVVGAQFQIATSSSGPWATSIPLTATSGAVNSTAIYVQYTGPATGTQTGTVTVSGGGAASKTIPLSGVIRTGGTAPSISTPTPTVINFGTVSVGSGNAVAQTFSYTSANPVGSLTLTAPAGYEISSSASYDYHTTMTPVFFGVGFTNTVYVRLKNPQTAGTFSGNVTVAMPGATTQSVAVTATVTNPAQLVLASASSLSLFTSNPGAPSTTQTISVNGTGLTSTLDVQGYTNFDVSLSPTTGFGAIVSINPTGGTVAPTVVYVRYNRATAGLDAGSLTVGSTGATNQFVNIYGDCFGTPAPAITEVGSLTSYTTAAGTPSANQTFTVSGANLTANMVITAPTDFEVSLSSSVGFGSIVTLTPTSGSVAATVIYARYNPAIAGSSSGNITITSTAAVTQTVAVNGSSLTSGISNLAKNENISIYPNPSSGLVFVKTTAKFQDMFVNVTDINGRVLLFEKLNSNNEQLDLNNNANGIYFVNIVDASKNVISKQRVILRK